MIGVILLLTVVVFPFITPINKYFQVPNEVVTFHNENSIEIPNISDNVSITALGDQMEGIDSSTFQAKASGSTELVYEVNGFPIKKVNLSVLDDLRVVPGGQSIGVQLQTRGVLVVGHHLVKHNEQTISPGEEAEINVGDVIVKVNDKPIEEMEDIKEYIVDAGQNNKHLHLTVKRGKEILEKKLMPVQDDQEKEYKIGLYIRDSAAGIGTMTFYEPKSKKYGALGHVISDMDTKKPVEINDGTIVRSSVTSIEKGNNGIPGEKQAKFESEENIIGNITKNSPFGIFGVLQSTIKNKIYDDALPIALSHEVKEGPAKILTVVEGEEVEEYEIEIISNVPQKYPATKGMVIQITDEELLSKTGGIVQGMSGSPIIQDGKVIGAVTHVFVNDPTSGYGVHIEWMLQDAGIDIYKDKKKAS